MKLENISNQEIVTDLRKEFGQEKLDRIQAELPALIKTSKTKEQLIARIYEVLNVKSEESYLKVNKAINRLDTRKDAE